MDVFLNEVAGILARHKHISNPAPSPSRWSHHPLSVSMNVTPLGTS